MSAPWGENSRPDEGCGFCSDFQRMKDDPEVCEGCPHEPDAYDPTTYHPDDIANGNAADAQTEDARRKEEDEAALADGLVFR